ncbi:GNAT family N-acetyltransferase [Ideonella sp. A 288]|uniref:GNAT family N-acetyltransferase n=1 Tax=Ideonella sp. A 288 TaxID=1962181 RepID=UPI001302F063|nr:GNAT family N-acetyltransferase [Ideonella sp. A 288]
MAAWQSAWDRLHRACQAPPFLQSRFVARALQFFGTGRERIAIAGPAGESVAMAVLTSDAWGRWHTFQPSQLPLGAWLMRPGLGYAETARGVFDLLPGVPLMLAITQQDPSLFSRPDDGHGIRSMDHFDSGWIDIRGDFDAYWRTRSPHLRQNLRTQLSRLRRQEAPPRLEVLTDPADMAGAIDDYARLESSGWKAAGGTALASGTPQACFYRAVMEDYCSNGQGTAYRLWFGDRVVAIDLCIAADGVEVLLKTTYDESVRGLSPSTILKYHALQRHFEQGDLSRCEYYGTFMPWTSLWTARRRRFFHVNCFRWLMVDQLRQWVRRWHRPSIEAHVLSPDQSALPVHDRPAL